MKTRALVTGFTGMVGSHLTDFLLENTNWDVYGMCRWRSPQDNVQHLSDRINRGDRVFVVFGDLRDYISLQNAVDEVMPDYVFHLAAQSYPQASFSSPVDTFDTNISGTARLLEVLRRCGGIDPIIHVCASSEVFGRVPKEKLPIDEECTFHPASPYAISKVGTDLVGRFFAEAYGAKAMTTRMFTHTGPRRGEVFVESTFAKQIALIENRLVAPVVHVGNLNSLRTWTDVRDAVRAYYMLVTVDPIAGEYYNIGGKYSCTVKEMLHFLLSMSTCDEIEVKEDPDRMRPIDADLQVPDVSKFETHTGWKPEIPFDQTMHDLLEYWRARIRKGEVFTNR